MVVIGFISNKKSGNNSIELTEVVMEADDSILGLKGISRNLQATGVWLFINPS